MQIPPSSALLNALSRAADPVHARPPATPLSSTPAEPARGVVTPDAARAAAKAAFQGLRPAQPVAVNAVMQPQTSAPPSQPPARPMPRGSFLNVLV